MKKEKKSLMDEIKNFIVQHSITLPKRLSRRVSMVILKSENYDVFLKKTINLMRQCKYRAALSLIESKKKCILSF